MYDTIAESILHGTPPPHGYIVDVVEKDDIDMMFLRLYADDINSKPDSYAYALTNWLNAILKQLNTWTTTKWTWEMAEAPRNGGMDV